jgi:SAM-dependent methyltransferase
MPRWRNCCAPVADRSDAGCGPGTWLQRTLARALELGFTRIDARGFDISPDMVALAQERAQTHASVSLRLEEGDLREPLAEETGSIDLCLCLYGVLNHIPRAALNNVAAELVRVTGGHLFVTARTVGSLPTIFVDAVEKAATSCKTMNMTALRSSSRTGAA